MDDGITTTTSPPAIDGPSRQEEAVAEPSPGPNVIDQLAEETGQRRAREASLERAHAALPGVVVGRIVAVAGCQAVVEFDWEGSAQRFPARLAISETPQLDQLCTLVFEQQLLSRPIVTGLVQQADDQGPKVLSSATGIELRCGDGKVVISPEGDITISGRVLTSRAYGPNRIQGASVKLN
ncbi:MAG: hypothetical protein AAGA68_02520 [Pseudomonadota bacterium]